MTTTTMTRPTTFDQHTPYVDVHRHEDSRGSRDLYVSFMKPWQHMDWTR